MKLWSLLIPCAGHRGLLHKSGCKSSGLSLFPWASNQNQATAPIPENTFPAFALWSLARITVLRDEPASVTHVSSRHSLLFFSFFCCLSVKHDLTLKTQPQGGASVEPSPACPPGSCDRVMILGDSRHTNTPHLLSKRAHWLPLCRVDPLTSALWTRPSWAGRRVWGSGWFSLHQCCIATICVCPPEIPKQDKSPSFYRKWPSWRTRLHDVTESVLHDLY